MLSGASAPQPGFRWGAVAMGVVVTFIISLVAAGVLALTIYATSITEQQASAVLLLLGLASLLLGAGYAAHRARTMGWAHGVVVGLAYVLLSLVLQPVLFAGSWTVGGILQRLMLGIAAGALGGVSGVNL